GGWESGGEGGTAVAGGVEPGGSPRRAGAAARGGALGGVAVVRLGAPAARVFELAGEGRGLSPWGDPGAGWEGGSGPGRAVAGAGAGAAGGSSRALAGASRARRGARGWLGGLARRVRAQGGRRRDGVGVAVGVSGAADPSGSWLRGGAAASSARVCHSACRAGCGTRCGDREARDLSHVSPFVRYSSARGGFRYQDGAGVAGAS